MTRLLILALVLTAARAQNPNTAIFPGGTLTDQHLPPAVNRAQTTLTQALDNSATSVTVADASRFPQWSVVTIDTEHVQITAKSGNTLTISRAFDGSSAAAHNNGATVTAYILAGHFNQLAAEVKALQAGDFGTRTVKAAGFAAGASAPTITGGTAGAWADPEGTQPTFAGAGIDGCYASSTAHGYLCSFNNGAFLPMLLGPATNPPTSTELGYVYGVTSGIQAQLNAKAPLASPTFTGTPAAPTAAADTNTTQIATTAYYAGQKGTANPAAPGTAAPGTSLKFAPIDHVHPAEVTAALKKRPCEIVITGSGTGGLLQDTDDALGKCKNEYGATLTVEGIRCWADTGTPSIMLSAAGGADILTGAFTAGTFGTPGSGVLSGTPTVADQAGLDIKVVTAGGAAHEVTCSIRRTL